MFDEAHVLEAVHRGRVHVTDREVGVQRGFAGERGVARIDDRERERELGHGGGRVACQRDLELEAERMWPELARSLVVAELESHGAGLARLEWLPVAVACEAVWRQLGVRAVIAEPREHDRHATAHGFARRVLGVRSGPQYVVAVGRAP